MKTKKWLQYSVVLFITGLLITLLGFTLLGWNFDSFRDSPDLKWYRTTRF